MGNEIIRRAINGLDLVAMTLSTPNSNISAPCNGEPESAMQVVDEVNIVNSRPDLQEDVTRVEVLHALFAFAPCPPIPCDELLGDC